MTDNGAEGAEMDNKTKDYETGETLVEEDAHALHHHQPPQIEFDFVDHFSLKQPSSSVRSRGGVTTRVYDLANDQLQLEHRIVSVAKSSKSNQENTQTTQIQVTMQRLRGGNMGLRILRTFYTLVSLLVAGFTFVLAANIIVMQALEIPRNSGYVTGTKMNVPVMVATCLSLPLLVYSMASVMILASVFVTDAWNGHVLYSLLLGPTIPRVYVEWYSFVAYMGTPLLAYSIAALMGKDNWQQVGGLAWYGCMTVSFIIFCALVLYREVTGCLELARIQNPDKALGALVQQAVLTSLMERYSGREERLFLTRERESRMRTSVASNPDMQPLRTHQSIYSRITTLSFNPFYEQVLPPQRHYSTQEIRETIPIVTRQGWSLEKMCCGLQYGRSRFAVHGPNALEPSQFQSTLIGTILGVILGLLMLAGVLYGAGVGWLVIVVVVVLGFLLVGMPCILSSVRVYRAMPTEKVDDDNDDNDEEELPSVYQAWSSFTVSKPKQWYCWFRLALKVGVFFVWPLVTMFVDQLPKLAVLFLVTGLCSMARQYLDASSIINHHYSLSKINFAKGTANREEADDDDISSTEEDKVKAMVIRARASEVLGKITYSANLWFWVCVFAIMGAYFIYSGVTASGTGEDFNTQTGRSPIRFLNDFYYPRQSDSMLYPTCQLTNQYALPGTDYTYALDYNFMAGIAYETPEVTDYVLDKWFLEEDFAIDETEFVRQWRADTGNSLESVSFKLFSFPSLPGVGILSIRGTETPIDALMNSQLYIGTVLTQVVRAAMPFSWIWDSIYPDLLATTTWVATDHLQKSEYYRFTTDFANDVLLNNYTVNGKSYQWLRTTGVSLGGGLALITGAQTDAWAFAFSGPNPTLGRKSFHPPISMQNLKEKVMNIKPDNDLISSIGDLVPNNQLVRCRTWPAKVYNCHSFWRIFCEYMYTCGSPEGRAGALCVCVSKWGYPEPIRRGGNLTFQEACDAEEANLISELGDIFGDAE